MTAILFKKIFFNTYNLNIANIALYLLTDLSLKRYKSYIKHVNISSLSFFITINIDLGPPNMFLCISSQKT